MNDNSKILIGIALLILILLIVCTPKIVAEVNTWLFGVQKADDATNYDTIKRVEDTCRAMRASYDSDRLTYEQYKDSENREERSWASQAKMRANKTASTYNNYILENSFVWSENVPDDVRSKLDCIE